MGSRHRTRFLFLALCVSALVALLPVAASADGVTLTIGSKGQLVAGVEVDISAVVNCATLPAPTAGSMSSLELEQAVSKSSIAHGSGQWPAVTCDGTDHPVTVAVFADPSGPPFKKGQAVVTSASFNVCTNSFPFVCEGGGAGPQVITIERQSPS